MEYNKVEALAYIYKLLDMKALMPDSETGIIQIDPNLYQELGQPIPGTLKNANKRRAKALAPAYISIWPKGVSSGNRSVRQGPVAITKKLTVYINKHPEHTDNQILNAAQRYVNYMQTKNYDFMTCSDYFIEKSQNSLLESYVCDPELNANVKLSGVTKMERMV